MRTAAIAVLACLGTAVAVLSAPGVTTAHADSQESWAVTASPFGINLLTHGRPVTGEAAGTTAGPGGRLSYQAGGSYHRTVRCAWCCTRPSRTRRSSC